MEREAATSLPETGEAGDRNGPAPAPGAGAAGASSEPAAGSASHELLAAVAGQLRKLGEDSSSVAAELRRRVELLGAPGTPRGSVNKVSHAVLRELLQTLAARADGIGLETELIAGVLERAREQLERARLASLPPQAPRLREPLRRGAGPPGAARQEAQVCAPALRAPAEPRRQAPPRLAPRSAAGPPEPPAGAGASGERVPEGVRLIAIQMALDGTDAAGIAQRLGEEFRVPEPGRAVEAVFGSQARSVP